jgi:hypothetical protein
VLLLSACDSSDEVNCKTLLRDSRTELLSLDNFSLTELNKTISQLEKTQQTCKDAQLVNAANDALDAINSLKIQAKNLADGKITDEIKKNVLSLKEKKKNGDPLCPSGQGYSLEGGRTMIRCTGPQYASLNKQQLRELAKKAQLPKLERAVGAEITVKIGLIQLSYFFQNDLTPASCIIGTSKEKTPWQVFASKVTGAPHVSIKENMNLDSSGKPLMLKLKAGKNKNTLLLGDCSAINLEEVLALSVEPDSESQEIPQKTPKASE